MPIGLFCLVYEVAIAHRRYFTSGTECIHLPQPDLLAIAKRHEQYVKQLSPSAWALPGKRSFSPRIPRFQGGEAYKLPERQRVSLPNQKGGFIFPYL